MKSIMKREIEETGKRGECDEIPKYLSYDLLKYRIVAVAKNLVETRINISGDVREGRRGEKRQWVVCGWWGSIHSLATFVGRRSRTGRNRDRAREGQEGERNCENKLHGWPLEQTTQAPPPRPNGLGRLAPNRARGASVAPPSTPLTPSRGRASSALGATRADGRRPPETLPKGDKVHRGDAASENVEKARSQRALSNAF